MEILNSGARRKNARTKEIVKTVWIRLRPVETEGTTLAIKYIAAYGTFLRKCRIFFHCRITEIVLKKIITFCKT